jgi:predicted Zn-ribbon and HTH transcriptional regulator
MSKIKISKQLRDILAVNHSIIENLKASKARGDKLLDKYRALVQEEVDRPANRFLDWTKVVDPYTDAVISSKVTDYELQKRYESFIKQLVEFEQQQLVDSEDFESLRYNFDRLLNTLFKLERKIVETRNRTETNLLRLRLQAIKRHVSSGAETIPSACSFCGNRLDPDLIGVESECPDCAQVPDDLKEKYALQSPRVLVKQPVSSRPTRPEPVRKSLDELEEVELDEPEEDDLDELDDDEDPLEDEEEEIEEPELPVAEPEPVTVEEPAPPVAPKTLTENTVAAPAPKQDLPPNVKEDIGKFLDLVSKQVGYKADIVDSAKQRFAELDRQLAERRRAAGIEQKASSPKSNSKQVKR